ncbi:MAG: hypothetical protein R8K46_03490 [Mariprofundaceae bacterium]
MKPLADMAADMQWKYCPHGLLCLAMLPFPFSVAAANILLGAALAAGIVLGPWRQGAVCMWRDHRWLTLAMLFYWGLMLLGLAWSGDRAWGLHVVGRQWFWLLVPILLVCLSDERWRQRFCAALSLALTLNLVYCVLQMGDLVHVTTIGSGPDDATGHIGHIGFGVVYGVWAAWLLHWGWLRAGRWRYGAWLLAAWSWFMIFSAQGRSGYLVALVLLLAVFYKHAGMGRMLLRGGAVSLALLAVLAMGSGKGRAMEVWSDMPRLKAERIEQADVHWSLWAGALATWRTHPLAGVGTGGFTKAAAAVKRERPELQYGGMGGPRRIRTTCICWPWRDGAYWVQQHLAHCLWSGCVSVGGVIGDRILQAL